MKIGMIISTPIMSPTGGVRIQAIMWRDGFKQLGHEAELINMWEEHDWKSYDAIIVLDFGGMFRMLIDSIYKYNKKIAIAPIIDPNINKYMYKFYCKYWGSKKLLGLTSRFNDLFDGCKKAQIFITRSNQETEYLSYACDISKDKIFQIPLSVRFQPLSKMPQKENFCLHVSRLRAANKNVERLIKSAIKYGYELYLAGSLNGLEDQNWYNNLVGDNKNIHYLGQISDIELQQWYKRAKIFALPSLVEGVGMVALEAAGYGCEIVLTNLGAPKEYYDGLAELVDPYSIDSIGKVILNCLNGKVSHQPQLMKYIDAHYSVNAITQQLVDAINTMK